jgi:ketosteroid isomerase-like protein
MKITILVCCALMAVPAMGVDYPSGSREAMLVSLEKMWNQAQITRDSKALAILTGDRFINTEWDGEVTERAAFLKGIDSPLFAATVMSVQDMRVDLYGETAVVTGVYHTKGTSSGKAFDHVGRFTDTWIYMDGKWACVASHTSLLKK